MNTLFESFQQVLADFGKIMGTELAMNENRCNFTVDGSVEVEIDYIEEAEEVVLWSSVGYALEDGFQEQRARALIELNELDAPNAGFTISMEPEDRMVVVHDHRPLEMFENADHVAAWINSLVELVNLIRTRFEEQFPCVDLPDDMDENETSEEQ
ncbi:MAG: type III secretion system chaperone [Victivallales bacterium]|nr:type III secretion system chaperone [Victivallales bacterium]